MGPAEERAVLLCDGKLRLSTIQQMFGLYLVEMLHSKLAPEHPLPLPAILTSGMEMMLSNLSAIHEPVNKL